MEDWIILGGILLVVLIGIRSGAKHLKGEGGCCGGGSEVKVKRKRLKHVIRQRTVTIEGMSCDHCKNRVESRLNELEGVSAKVDLKKKTAVISMEKEVSDEELCDVIKRAGYEPVAIH